MTPTNDFPLVLLIAKRANEFAPDIPRLAIAMDIDCVHARHPLRIEELLAADDANFTHDVFGIMKHLNRETGELENFFVPRFTA